MVSNFGKWHKSLLCQHTLSWKHQHSTPQGQYINSSIEKEDDNEELKQLLFIESLLCASNVRCFKYIISLNLQNITISINIPILRNENQGS